MRIVFAGEAIDDLRDIHALVAKENPRAADNLIRRIFDKIEYLLAPELTYIGRPGLDPGTHELIEPPTSSCTRCINIAGTLWCSRWFMARKIESRRKIKRHTEPPLPGD
jgi:hypothetical protein